MASVRQACAFLGVGAAGLCRMTDEGKLPCVRRGKMRRYRWTDLEALRNATRPAALPDVPESA